jgi:hypothetical protein
MLSMTSPSRGGSRSADSSVPTVDESAYTDADETYTQ